MKKLLFCALLLCVCLSLCSCSGNTSIDDLLTAPPLTEDQAQMIAALEKVTDNQITFVYPTTGTIRAAIRQNDLDNDGDLEAITLFSVPAQGLYAAVGVLEKESDGSYTLASIAQGLGDGINSCSILSPPHLPKVMLIEWTTPGKAANSLTAYCYIDGELQLGLEENCADLLVMDFDSDGISDFCYVSPATAELGFSLKFAKLHEESVSIEGQIYLNPYALGVRNIHSGSLANGDTAVFIDELFDDGIHTEVIALDDKGSLVNGVYGEGFDIYTISKRSDSELLYSRNVSSICSFPSDVAPFSGVLANDQWTYWYSVESGSVIYKKTAFLNAVHKYALCVPDNWLATCIPVYSEEDSGVLRIYSTAEERTLVTLYALPVSVDAEQYIKLGYTMLGTNGGYRFYCLFDCSDEDIQTIKGSFFIL